MASAGELEGGGEAGPPRTLRLKLPDRLPHLMGRRGNALRILYLVVALAALVVICGSFWFNGRDYFGNMPTAASYGFRTQTSRGAVSIAGPSSEEARRSGLARGDAILAIDGRRVAADATEFEIADLLGADADGRITLVTRSRDGTVREHRLTRQRVTSATVEPTTELPLWLFIALGFTSTQLPLLVWFAASLILARRRPRDPEAMLFAFGFLLMTVNAGSAFWIIAHSRITNAPFEDITNFGACLLMAAIAGFPDGRFTSLWSRLTLMLIILLAVLVVAGPSGTQITAILFLIVTVGVAGSVLLRYRRESAGPERQQIKWAVLGFASALVLILPVQVISTLDLAEGQRQLQFVLNQIVIPLALVLMAAGLLVSLLRYRLYDAEAAISRSAGYALLTLMLGATFAASSEAIEWFFETNFGGEAGALPGAIAAALAVVLITPLNNRVQAWAERRFQKGLVRLRRDLPEAVGDLRETSDLPHLLDEVLGRLADGVRASWAAVLVGREIVAAWNIGAEAAASWSDNFRPDAGLEALGFDRDDPLFPVRLPLRVRYGGGEPVGWILLGPRPDGSFYGSDEREVLAEVADPIARAVQIVGLRDERMREQEERLRALEAAVAKLTAARA